jgi:hypothetical protein
MPLTKTEKAEAFDEIAALVAAATADEQWTSATEFMEAVVQIVKPADD